MKSTMMSVPLSLNHFLERLDRLYPESTVVSRMPDRSLRRHTYAEYARRARALASALQGLGLRKGERVATLCWNHHVHLECYFGIPAAGGVTHTLNLRLAPEELGWVAAHAQGRFLIVDDLQLPLLRQFQHLHRFEKIIVFRYEGREPLEPGFIDYEELLRQGDPDTFRAAPHDENDPVSLCYTSGTTGRPKGVAFSHRSVVLHCLTATMADTWGLSHRDVVMPVTPMFHSNAWELPFGCIMQGVKLVLPGPHLQARDLLDLIQSEQPTLAVGVPTIWMELIRTYEEALAKEPGRWQLPAGMRSLVGGSAVPESLIRSFDRHGVRIMQGWGMTETSAVASVAYRKPDMTDDDGWFRVAATQGVPMPLVDLRLVDDAGVEQPWDGRSVGEIQVRGPYIAGAYHGLEPTPDKFTADGWLRTGDVAAVDARGYIRISDRSKDLIKSGGEWISSVDLENALMAHPAIAEACVIAVPHPKWDERPLACVVPRAGQTAEPQALSQHLLQTGFAKWQLPDRYEVMDQIPRNSMGKFWKQKLREQFAQGA